MLHKYLLTGFTIMFFTVVSFGDNGGPRDGDVSGRMWNDLKLTTEQKEQLKSLSDEMVTARLKNNADILVVRQKIVTELQKSNPSKSILDRYARELGDLHMKSTQSWNEHLLGVKKIFTPEQFNMMIKPNRAGGNFEKGRRRGGQSR